MPKLNKIKPTLSKTKTNDNWSKDRWYNKQEWRRLRNYKKNIAPICENCERKNIITPMDCVDHIKPIRLWPELKLSMDNLQSLCNHCHLIKTRKERDATSKEHWYNIFENNNREGGYDL